MTRAASQRNACDDTWCEDQDVLGPKWIAPGLQLTQEIEGDKASASKVGSIEPLLWFLRPNPAKREVNPQDVAIVATVHLPSVTMLTTWETLSFPGRLLRPGRDELEHVPHRGPDAAGNHDHEPGDGLRRRFRHPRRRGNVLQKADARETMMKGDLPQPK